MTNPRGPDEGDDAGSAPPPTDPDERRLAEATPSRAATLTGRILNPPQVVAAVWIVGCVTVPDLSRPDRCIFLALGLVALVIGPYLMMRIQLHRGLLGDQQVVRRGERHGLYAAVLGWVAAGCLLLGALGAPLRLLGVAIAMLLGLGLVAAANLATKASLHVATVSGATVILLALCRPVGVGFLLAVPLTAWARLREGRHTVTQVVLGACLGAAGASCYLLI